jgi:hypothetical protein
MQSSFIVYRAIFGLSTLFAIACGSSNDTPSKPSGITSPSAERIDAPFDVVRTSITTQGANVVFRIEVRGEAGAQKPGATGAFAGSSVFSYVWPTSLDTSTVGFEAKQGILALAATYHPDFDDGAKGAVNRGVWHPHWIVLVKDDACGAGSLKVKDIPEGTTPALPRSWPGVPLLIDSPAYPLVLDKNSIEIRVPRAEVGAIESASFDGVTSALKVNANLHAPLLCITNVFDIASGDLSLPGKVDK